MIVTETLTIDGRQFVKTYSDSGYMVERNRVRYSEAVDPAEFGRVYTETDEPIASMTEDIPAEEALNIIMGGTV